MADRQSSVMPTKVGTQTTVNTRDIAI